MSESTSSGPSIPFALSRTEIKSHKATPPLRRSHADVVVLPVRGPLAPRLVLAIDALVDDVLHSILV